MIAVSSCFQHVSRCKTKISLSLATPRSSASGANPISLFGSRFAPRDTRPYPYKTLVTSIRTGFPWSWPFLAILSKVIGNCQSLATQASQGVREVTDEELDQILTSTGSASNLTNEVYTAHVSKLCEVGNLLAAARFVQSLRDRNIFLHNAYHILLAAAVERNDIDISSQIFKDLLSSGKPLSSTSYVNIARAFTKIDDPTQLLRFVKEVSELAFPGSTKILNRIISAFFECRQIEKALMIFDQIKGLGFEPDLITYNTVLNIFGCTGRINEMLQLFASMKEAGVGPDIVSYNTLLNSLRKVGRLDICLAYFREMEKIGIEPDLLTYTALIDCFGRSGNTEESLRLFSEMKLRRIRPSIYIYRSLISNLKRVGKVKLALKLLEEMSSSSSDMARPEDFKRKAKVVKR